MSLTKRLTGNFGLDRRESAVEKQSTSGSYLYELENYMVDQGVLETREGLTRLSSAALETVTGTAYSGSTGSTLITQTAKFTSDMVGCIIANTTDGSTGQITTYTSTTRVTAVLTGGVDNSWTSGDAFTVTYPILALHRFYGLNQNDGSEIKEIYCAVADKLKRWNTITLTWDDFYLPPGFTLTKNVKGTFCQMKDRTYYSNGVDAVLSIKKEDLQVYEAGIPDPNVEVVIDDCESLTGWTLAGAGSHDAHKTRFYLDAGFDRHTQGDYGITIESSDSAADLSKYVTLTKTLDTALDLTWFFKTISGRTESTSIGNTVLVADTGYSSYAAFTAGMVGQQVKNVTDGSVAVITDFVSATSVKTTPLSGGTDNTWSHDDLFTVGEPSSEYDYIAMDVFRFTKIDIDEVKLEFGYNGGFTNSYSATIYVDSGDYTNAPHQHTMLAQWAVNPRSNTLFFCKFRKSWFVPTGSPAWDNITHVRVTLRKNNETTGTGTARITIDNIRLLKTPPVPASMRLQVATCDASETWSYYLAAGSPGDDYIRAVQGVSCKVLASGTTGLVTWSGGKDLSQYGEGTDIGAADLLAFEVCGMGSEVITNLAITFTFVDGSGRTTSVTSTIFDTTGSVTYKNMQIRTRKIPIKDFYPTSPATDFSWNDVREMRVTNTFGTLLYIDDIRIEPASCTKMIESFVNYDTMISEGLEYIIDTYLFQENPTVDRITDYIFQWWTQKRYQASGQGRIIPADYKHGRYKVGDYTLASLQIQADAGGAMSCTYVDDTDLTEYEESRFHLDAFLHPREYKNSLWGYTWDEVPATDNDEMSIWFSTPNTRAIKEIQFKFFCSKSQGWAATGKIEGTHSGSSGSKVLTPSPALSLNYLGKRIRNTKAGNKQTGIITYHSLDKTRIVAWGSAGKLTWNNGDTFEIEKWETTATKHEADPDNYYQYTMDCQTMFKGLEGVIKNVSKAVGSKSFNEYKNDKTGLRHIVENTLKYDDDSYTTKKVGAKNSAANADYLEMYRELADEYGLTLVYRDQDVDGNNWWQGVVKWKRKDLEAHLTNEQASYQNIAAIQITVVATNRNAIVNFQDLKMEKKGPISGDVLYKVVLEDEQGRLGPASTASKKVTANGSTVNLTDIYVPHDTRIARKRIYRTDSAGEFRYVDTIDRLNSSYLDEIEEEFLGPTIGPDYYKPPKAKVMRKVDNKMAYAQVRDRNDRYKPSTIYISEAFAPHQCSDLNIFDVLPDDGQKITGIEWYYGTYLVWKENSFYTVDPENFRYIPRDREKGCIAPNSMAAIPGVGYAWLSHEGVVIGNHTDYDDMLGLQIWDDLKGYSLETLSKAVGFYYDRHYLLFVGDKNEKGYALYLPYKKWFYISGWSVQCAVPFRAGTDSNELYAGSTGGYVNRLFYGNTDWTDDAVNAETDITTSLRFFDYDFDAPEADKHHQYLVLHVKNLVEYTNNRAVLTVSPYCDQIVGERLNEVTVPSTHYQQMIVNMAEETPKSLLGVKITGVKRHAIRDMVLVSESHGFRPNQ